jgi:hypothetical protein
LFIKICKSDQVLLDFQKKNCENEKSFLNFIFRIQILILPWLTIILDEIISRVILKCSSKYFIDNFQETQKVNEKNNIQIEIKRNKDSFYEIYINGKRVDLGIQIQIDKIEIEKNEDGSEKKVYKTYIHREKINFNHDEENICSIKTSFTSDKKLFIPCEFRRNSVRGRIEVQGKQIFFSIKGLRFHFEFSQKFYLNNKEFIVKKKSLFYEQIGSNFYFYRNSPIIEPFVSEIYSRERKQIREEPNNKIKLWDFYCYSGSNLFYSLFRPYFFSLNLMTDKMINENLTI